MNTVVSYDAVRTLLANPPSINPRPNFFNIRELRSHFAKALKKIPCPQSAVNGWAGAVMSPEMYALVIDQNTFHLNIAPRTRRNYINNSSNDDHEQRCASRCSPHRYTSPQHYPNINKGIATPHSSLEDVAEQQEDAEEEADVDEHDEDAVGEHPKFTCLPCHTWEVTSSYLTSREANTNLSKRSTSPTKMYATRVDLTSTIGTRAQLAPTRNKVTRTDSHVQTTCSTNKRGILFAKRRCTRRFTRRPDGVGQ
jgi:hypothetical protein